MQPIIFLLCFMLAAPCFSGTKNCETSSNNTNLLKSSYQRLTQIWRLGDNELYVPTYAWHNRYRYSPERIKTFNEHPWGGGLGKSFYDENGNWHGLYAMAFLDSHKNLEPVAGYAFLKVLHINDNARIGIGYTVLVTARPDIFHNIPFPGILPWFSINYKKISLSGSYIPGAQGAGNVLFLATKILLS